MKHYKLLFLILSAITALFITSVIPAKSSDMGKLQKGIANKIVRFHVLANSDSDEDQALKQKVRDAVIEYISPILLKSNSLEESEELLANNSEAIIRISRQVITENGYNYEVNICMEDTFFPAKKYGSLSFPPGTYKAFRILIGKGEGKNWWCVLYPPLCFIDISHGVVSDDGTKMLKNILTTDEFDAVSGKTTVEFRFKYLTFLNKLLF